MYANQRYEESVSQRAVLTATLYLVLRFCHDAAHILSFIVERRARNNTLGHYG